MADRVESVTGINRISPLRGYTPAERAKKIQEIEQAAADRKEIIDYLAKFPNPNHLSFAELLQEKLSKKEISDDDLGYILDIKSKS